MLLKDFISKAINSCNSVGFDVKELYVDDYECINTLNNGESAFLGYAGDFVMFIKMLDNDLYIEVKKRCWLLVMEYDKAKKGLVEYETTEDLPDSALDFIEQVNYYRKGVLVKVD